MKRHISGRIRRYQHFILFMKVVLHFYFSVKGVGCYIPTVADNVILKVNYFSSPVTPFQKKLRSHVRRKGTLRPCLATPKNWRNDGQNY